MKAIIAILLIYVLIYAGIHIVDNGSWLDRLVYAGLLMGIAITTFTKTK